MVAPPPVVRLCPAATVTAPPAESPDSVSSMTRDDACASAAAVMETPPPVCVKVADETGPCSNSFITTLARRPSPYRFTAGAHAPPSVAMSSKRLPAYARRGWSAFAAAKVRSWFQPTAEMPTSVRVAVSAMSHSTRSRSR